MPLRRSTRPTVPTYPLEARAKKRLKGRKNQPSAALRMRVKRSGGASCALSRTADSAGDKVSELNAEITVEIAIVSANCLKNWPDRPLMNAVGRNTAHRTSAVA